jgi:hypothetical protein
MFVSSNTSSLAKAFPTSAGKKNTFGQLLVKQIKTQKELYLPPVIIVISTLPQTILAFSFACTELNQAVRMMFFFLIHEC